MTSPADYIADVGMDDAGQRIDRFLAVAWPDLSRARIVQLLRAGDIRRADAPDRPVGPADKTRPGDRYELAMPPPAPAAPEAQAMDLDVVYEDDDLIVVDKPAGMTVHPAPGQMTGTLVNALLAHCGASLSGIGGVARPGIVHRIDKDTSGLIVAAKHDRAHQGLAAQFAAHSVDRAYRALVWGLPGPAAGRIEGAIGRDPRNRKRMAITPSGKTAATGYRVIAAFGVAAAEVECRLETGRTHQIRVHLASKGWPLIGDRAYAKVTAARKARLPEPARSAAVVFARQALHAASLGFAHPADGRRCLFSRPPPEDYARLYSALEMAAQRQNVGNPDA